MSLVRLVLMSAFLGASSFACGVLPLSFVFSKSHLDRLTALGTGLLLGTALGVIIPEGIEAVVASPSHSMASATAPTSKIALSLLFGFTCMFLIEQLVAPHSHSHSAHSLNRGIGLSNLNTVTPNTLEFDAELGELELEAGLGEGSSGGGNVRAEAVKDNTSSRAQESHAYEDDLAVPRAVPLTLGLIVHGLADGLALGVSFLPSGSPSPDVSSSLSLIVFLALVIHKAPTSLALTTSLLATSLPRAKCRRHLAAFSASTPLGALASYLLISFLGDSRDGADGGWTGTALLVSGGTFLYVATVLQPVSHQPSNDDIRPATRMLFIVSGMFIPYILSTVLSHDHRHS